MRGPLVAGLLNLVLLSAFFIGNLSWTCDLGHRDDARDFDAPLVLSRPASRREDASAVPPHLEWDASPVQVPDDWSYRTPRFCNATDVDRGGPRDGRQQRIIVHYHMQHNAGTNFWAFAKKFVPCATRACWQDSKHCLVSYDEDKEADNIRRNYERHGVQYVSYEVMLPPRFPLPFVSERARRGLFFTTIVRDPFKRLLTHLRKTDLDGGHGARSPFWLDFNDRQMIYAADNLNARWLSGMQGSRLNTALSTDRMNVAKCRLQLFDLVIADRLYEYAVKKVMCPLNGWTGKGECGDAVSEEEHRSKSDVLKNGTDPLLIGAWVERLRPSFELYDYARILSWRQLQDRGVTNLPELSEVPSYITTLSNYANIEVTEAHLKKMRRVTLDNEEHLGPPAEFCERMKRVWTSNADEVPNAYGIGTIMKGFHPRTEKETRGRSKPA